MIYNYNEFLNEFLNSDFNFNLLCSNGISFARKIRYCDEHLVKIKSGSGRTVYKFDNDKVIKVAKNKAGIAQNEIENGLVNFDYDIVTKVYTYDYLGDNDDNGYIVIAEYADKVTKNKFNELTGIDYTIIEQFLNTYFDKNKYWQLKKEHFDELKTNEFLNELVDLCGTFDLLFGDFDRLSTYGIVNRNGKETVALVDYGLTNDVYKEYYRR